MYKVNDGIQFDWNKLRVGVGHFADDTQWFPAKAEVCGNCRGKGKTVNPAIDGNGLSSEDFAEDPDFAQDYMSGKYDVSCCECGGRGMTLEPSSEDGQKAVSEWRQDNREAEATYRAEARMGA